MANVKQIKIIKRAERDGSPAPLAEKSEAHIRNSAERVKHDAATIVTGWVQEVRQRRVAEVRRGFESLFNQSAAGAPRD